MLNWRDGETWNMARSDAPLAAKSAARLHPPMRACFGGSPAGRARLPPRNKAGLSQATASRFRAVAAQNLVSFALDKADGRFGVDRSRRVTPATGPITRCSPNVPSRPSFPVMFNESGAPL
jgi:hypothetical protein